MMLTVTVNKLVRNKRPALQRVFFVVQFFLIVTHSNFVFCENTSSFEIGMGVGGQSLNHYRGSSQVENVVLPFPLLIYYGNFWKIDEKDGLRGELWIDKKVEFNLSGDLELRSSTEDNVLRQGMPELDTAMQLGPEFNVNLSGEGFDEGWKLRLPVRAAFTITFDHPQFIGYTFNPKLTYIKPDFYKAWRLKSDFALLYSSDDFHEYYYSVSPEYVTAARPMYAAHGGYSGAYAKIGFYKRDGNWLYKFSLRYDYLGNTSFDDSPLVETESFYAFSFGMAYIFAKKAW